MRLLCPLVLLFAAALARADDPKIVGSTAPVEPYKVVRLSVTGLDDKAGVLWRVRPADPKAVPDFGLGGKRNLRDLEFTAPPGVYVVELVIVRGTGAGGFSIDELTATQTIGEPDARPKPKPVPPPKPKPDPGPAPVADADLVAKYKTALAADGAAKFPGGGSKEMAAALGDVYLFAAERLASETPDDWPKTGGDLFEKVAAVAAEKKVPRLPVLAAVRAVSSEVLGTVDSAQALDSAKRADLAARYKRAGAALKEAAK